MEESITKLNQTLASFCNNLQSSCDALRQSLDRRPIPLDSASTTFIQSLNRRVSPLSKDLNLLESMSFGTVSFEELLGHCNEVYKKNQSDLVQLHYRLESLGYVSSKLEIDEDEVDVLASSVASGLDSGVLNGEDGLHVADSYGGSILKSLEDNSLFEESLSLRNLGLSDVCLATIESEGDGRIDELDLSSNALVNYEKEEGNAKAQSQHATNSFNEVDEDEDKCKFIKTSISKILVSKDDYESLPSYLKILASWEDLHTAVDKINSSLSKKANTKESNYFCSEELESMGLGPKARSYLLLLVRMKRLLVEANNGLISYRIL
ncbi:hypothetical protein Ancab_032373 [Ancistrocladus abbreviatus]